MIKHYLILDMTNNKYWLTISGDTPITFSGNSYAKWRLLESIENRLSLSLRIKTRKESASLMYAKGRVDYSILEVGILVIYLK